MPRCAFLPYLATILAATGCGTTSGSSDGGAADASSTPDVGTSHDGAGLADADAGRAADAVAAPDVAADAPGAAPDAVAPVDAQAPDADAADAAPNDGASACGVLPSGGLYATFAVGADVFHASITSASGIAGALALWHGTSTAAIPDGKLICMTAKWNCPWHWEMDPATIAFADLTTEVCDGLPSYVEGNCATFGGGSYCPWAAKMTELRDCRTDVSCPVVPK